VLRGVFRETWRALIQTIEKRRGGRRPAALRSWRRDPDLVRVLVL
jgi:hypothetical protein